MKFELTPDQQRQLNRELEKSNIRKWFQQKDSLNFSVGDVLIKQFLRTDWQTKKESWVTENINSDNKMAQRYVYVHEDEYGIGYIKPLRVSDGTLGKDIYCMLDFDFSCTRFQVDPEFAEKVLLDGEFDIKEVHKRSLATRKIASKMNRKLGQKPDSLQALNDIFDKLNVGDTFWTTSDYTGRYLREHKITSIKKIAMKDLDSAYNYAWTRWKEANKGKINSTYSYKISYTGTYNHTDQTVTDFLKYVIYTRQKPALPEDQG